MSSNLTFQCFLNRTKSSGRLGSSGVHAAVLCKRLVAVDEVHNRRIYSGLGQMWRNEKKYYREKPL